MGASKRMADQIARSSWVRKMFEEARQAKSQLGEAAVLDFTLGNPIGEPPYILTEALRTACSNLRPGLHRYMNNAGHQYVREAVAAHISSEYGVDATADYVVMSCGAAGGLNVILKTLLDPGDEVLAISPYFPEYEFYVENHGGTIRYIESDDNFMPDPVRIAAAVTPRTKAMILNSPNNPTGAVYTESHLIEVSRALQCDTGPACNIPYLLLDDIYRSIVYDDPAPSVPAIYDNSIVINSWSKSLNVPGERIGYIFVSPRATDARELVEGCITATRTLGFVNAPALMQHAIASSLAVKPDLEPYRRNRDILCNALNRAGFSVATPGGAFYLFARCPGGDDLATCAMLRAKGLFAVPGRGFGRPGYLRFAYALDYETCEAASKILESGTWSPA